MKPSDAFCWAACRDHHNEQHQIGERAFAEKYGLDLLELCKLFYRKSPHRNKLDDPYGA